MNDIRFFITTFQYILQSCNQSNGIYLLLTLRRDNTNENLSNLIILALRFEFLFDNWIEKHVVCIDSQKFYVHIF